MIQLVSFSRSDSTSAFTGSGSLLFDSSHVVLPVSWSGTASASASDVSTHSLSVATGSFFSIDTMTARDAAGNINKSMLRSYLGSVALFQFQLQFQLNTDYTYQFQFHHTSIMVF